MFQTLYFIIGVMPKFYLSKFFSIRSLVSPVYLATNSIFIPSASIAWAVLICCYIRSSFRPSVYLQLSLLLLEFGTEALIISVYFFK